MPYIPITQRDDIGEGINMGSWPTPDTAGQLNYCLTMLCNQYMKRGHKSYQEINDIVGALECCKMEFYARIVRPYEEIKMKENGDVY